MAVSSDTSSLSASVMNLNACSLGLSISLFFYGIGCVQVFMYYTVYGKKDNCLHKTIVLSIWSLDSIHTAISLAAVHDIINKTLRQPEKENLWSLVVFISSITGLALVNVVQILYTLRLWIVSERQYYKQLRWLTALCGSAVAVSIGCNIAAVYYACVLNTSNDMPLEMVIVKAQLSVYLSIGSWLLADFIIATSLCYVLHTSKNGFLSTDSFLNRYMTYFVSAGVIVSVASVIELALYLALGNSIVLFGCSLVVEKLYINSYMAMLNGRKFMRQEPEQSESASNCTEGQFVDICRATLQQEHGNISKDLESGCTTILTQAHDIIICLESAGASSIDL